ncbi:hypothetical protein SVAN01_07414 [Stagonosporopsis vannaccii]|nr:hypothetical protein SVAN01_07414 [Stagonosporopsis vannaccii]
MQLLTAAALLFAVTQAATSYSCAQFSPNPVAPSQLPSYFPRQKITNVAHLADIEDIRQTLSDYAFIIDARAFSSLASIFTPDAVANYSAPLGVLRGVSAIETTLSAALAQFPGTQHLLGTQRIRICDKDSAVSATYFQATHFLQPNATAGATGVADDSGVLYAFAQYQDSWVKRDGLWKIGYRNVVYMGPLITDLN